MTWLPKGSMPAGIYWADDFQRCPNPNPKQLYDLFGNVGRNSVVGPNLVDFSLFKNVPIRRISEAFSMQFRAEFFNVLNHPSFLPPLDSEHIFNRNGTPINSGGAIDATANDNREIQFGIWVIW